MELKGISMKESIDILAKETGITPTEADINKKTNDVLKENLYYYYIYSHIIVL